MFPVSVLYPEGFLVSDVELEEDEMSFPGMERMIEVATDNNELLAIIQQLIGNPWPPESGGFASGCRYCGKSYPAIFSDADEHYDNCIWVKATAIIEKYKTREKENALRASVTDD